jgi:hypothetical protein
MGYLSLSIYQCLYIFFLLHIKLILFLYLFLVEMFFINSELKTLIWHFCAVTQYLSIYQVRNCTTELFYKQKLFADRERRQRATNVPPMHSLQ